MRCPKCQHENTLEAKFCEECAATLAPTCGNCGSPVSSTAKFCSQCGHPLQPVADDTRFASPRSYTPQHLAEKILTSRAALEGERKQVTVLFADIKGSMELLADRDAEAAQTLLFDPVLERMIEAVHRYEGTVHRVLGDGIMALFGAPLAVEDHAVRACYAGLRMQETVTRYAEEVQRSQGVQVAIRVGVNSGEIVVRTIGNDLHMDYTVVGQTVHLASRMEQMAKPGSVLTTADTLRLAEGYLAMEPLGPVPVKGLANPVQIYEVTGAGAARTRLQAAAGRGLTRFVGRGVQLDQLLRAQRLAGHGRGQVVAIIGEAGVGKSRLVHEFLYSHQTADWLVLESNSASYGRATPYLPVIELLRRYFKVNVDDSTQSIREKISDRILTLDPALHVSLPPLLDLLDALDDEHPFRSLDPIYHRQYTYQAVTRLLLSETRAQPVVAVVEDLHWNDALTLGLLNELVVATQNVRLLLVVNYRPEYRDEWRDLPNYHQLRLDPLASESLADLLQALLGSNPSLTTLKSFLVERASGNPFFVEEIVRSLVDTGVLEGVRGRYGLAKPFLSFDVPPTVRSVLAARIDALPPGEKRVLEEAAVIGHDVPFTVLHAIRGLTEDRLRSLLDNLQAAEFLYATQIFPDLQYSFKHSLTHDVTYSGVLHERRRDIHARVVDAIEQLYTDRLGEQVERLAHHAMRGEKREKAVHYLWQAGGKAVARSALSDARTWFEQALGVLDALPRSRAALEQAFEIRLELRRVLRQLGEGRTMLECLREAEALAEWLEDDRRRGQVYALRTTVHSTLDELDEALVTGTRALEIAERLGDLRLRIVATSHLEQVYYYRGEYRHVFDNLAALPAGGVHEYFGMAALPSVFGRAYSIMSLAELGRFAEAAQYAAEAIQIAEPTQHVFTIGWAYFAASMLHLVKGDWAKALSQVEHWIAMLRTANVAMHLPWAVPASAWVLAQLGEAGEALNRVREGAQLLEHQAARGIVGHRGWAYGAVGRACLLLGRLDEARRLTDCSVESARRQPGSTAHALRLLGDIASHPDRFDAESAAAHYREALALAQLHGMRPLVAQCHLGLGKLYRRIGETEHARENLTTATTMYRDLEMGSWLDQGEAHMAKSGDMQPPVRSPSKSSTSGDIRSP
ncbi:MAG: zinc-ribbon domain-containing protein [Alphaproteobacteria bacterium]|nr:MAG: zinc-ribbon domain-containing protein [Alphaproteobacteria bacterium]